MDDRYCDAYERAVGVRLDPGSLDIVVDEPWVIGHPTVRLEAAEVGVGTGLVSCRLDNWNCWILRTDRSNPASEVIL